MKAVYATAGFALGASAAILPRQQCCFSLTASGGHSGAVSQLGDGQNRIGAGAPSGSASYCINNGELTDGQGRGCILTPPTTQFQCDTGASPSPGFSVTSNGELAHNGSTTFYACAASSNEYNIYTSTSDAQTMCSEIMLSTGGKCAGSGAGASSAASASKPAGSTASAPGVYSTAQKSAPVASSAASTPVGQSTAPAKSAPVYSAPAESTPAVHSTAPAYSAPVYSHSAPSAPVYSHSAPVYSHSAPVYSHPGASSAPVYSHPAESTPVKSAPANSAPATYGASTPAASAPAASTPAASAPAASTPAASAPAASAPASGTAHGSACQTALTGAYQTPHLIVPVSSNSPDTAYGTSYFGQINSTTSTIFNFDIPQSYQGKQCSLVFLFPEKKDLTTSTYTFSGSGSIHIQQLGGVATQQTTWNTVPKASSDLGSIAIQPGNSYVMTTQSCEAGMTESIEISSEGGLALNFFEDYNPSPLGVYITSC